MTFKVSALAIDIDGTLTDKKRRLNCEAVETLRKVKVPIILATGNISCFARTAAKLIGVSDMVICENGGVVRFSYDGEDIVLGDIKKCMKAAEEISKKIPIELLDQEYRKSEVCMRRTFPIEEAKKIIEEKKMDVRIVDTGFAYHIIDNAVSKGKALKYMAEKIGIDVNDFAAIGDSENDIEMIEIAGIGIAVGNADLKLKEVADIVVPEDDGKGVVQALKILGLVK